MNAAALINERAITHGDYSDTARTAQTLKEVYRNAPGWYRLTPRQRESMEAEAVKNARILCGDPNEPDHWRDKIGYSKLVLDGIEGE
jgi:hypothetical protein